MTDTQLKTPQKIYLKDYKAPNIIVNDVNLTIKLFEDHATVDSVLDITYQGEDDIVLYGVDLELLNISVNDEKLTTEHYTLDDEKLVIHSTADNKRLSGNGEQSLIIAISITNIPHKNHSLEGLYIAGEGDDTMFVTQCEPEGFRKITFFPDRPDVLTEYTTRLEADNKFKTLLANGNLIDSGELADNRHFTVWHDPIKKPSYLFAAVFADLSVISDSYTTTEGREVLLEIYSKEKDIDKCDLAMQALKDSMKWDEDYYGRCYDLDRFMIVAVSQFNMGAMENKGLNIFNTACVLSSPETTTDNRSFSVKAIIAHEYFHNWTGNRITCRDWFQLCLKEGLTVYRDQCFSACQQSPAVQRIDDVGILRARQFSEDAGPLAHPVRPDNFIEINNFYTATIYEKGAEIVRMLANMMGAEKYRQGTDEYFNRYDGQAVTMEDFLDALNSVDERVGQFISWYSQPGTPNLSCFTEFDETTKNLTINLSQDTRHVNGYPEPVALPMPVACAVFDKATGKLIREETILLTEENACFVWEHLDIEGTPVVSVLRDLSAPVNLHMSYSAEDLAFLVAHETNGFNRWQATQNLIDKVLKEPKIAHTYTTAVNKAVNELFTTDPMLAARLFDKPSENEMVINIFSNYNPQEIKDKHTQLTQNFADTLSESFAAIYEQLPIEPYEDSPKARGVRALRNACLKCVASAEHPETERWAITQYNNAQCMTERLGALNVLAQYKPEVAKTYLDDFFKRFEDDELVVDVWFTVQASAESTSLDDIQELIRHERFDWNTPNRVRSVLGPLSHRPTDFWSVQGLEIYTNAIQKLDATNPVFAARLSQALAKWSTLVPELKDIAHSSIKDLRSQVSSKNVIESLDSLLADA